MPQKTSRNSNYTSSATKIIRNFLVQGSNMVPICREGTCHQRSDARSEAELTNKMIEVFKNYSRNPSQKRATVFHHNGRKSL
jgi:hypothetical protein